MAHAGFTQPASGAFAAGAEEGAPSGLMAADALAAGWPPTPDFAEALGTGAASSRADGCG